jgi:predicted nucleotidyltransferase
MSNPLSVNHFRTVLVDALRPDAYRIEAFGSVARDEADSDSDMDVLVTLGDRPTCPCISPWEVVHQDLPRLKSFLDGLSER